MQAIQIQPSDALPGCTQLTVTPDVPGYVQVSFGTGLVVSVAADGDDAAVKANILSQLGLTEQG